MGPIQKVHLRGLAHHVIGSNFHLRAVPSEIGLLGATVSADIRDGTHSKVHLRGLTRHVICSNFHLRAVPSKIGL